MTEASHDNFKACFERAEAILHTLERGEADVVLSRRGPSFLQSMDVIKQERQVKLALEERVKANAIDLIIARKAEAASEAANFAKSDFLAYVSHELRTPLNLILGFAQLMETSVPPPTDVQIERLDQISKAGWYLLGLINELLDHSLIESGSLSMSLESISPADVMRECHAMIEPLAIKSGINLDFHPIDSAVLVHADKTRLKQIIINLLANAIKYNREHGNVEVTSTCTAKRLRISIRDSGMGMSAEKLAQLFLPFNRLGQENGVVEGTGIGLVVTKRLVELMGGAIGVESTVGIGSVFWFELKRLSDPQPANGVTEPLGCG